MTDREAAAVLETQLGVYEYAANMGSFSQEKQAEIEQMRDALRLAIAALRAERTETCTK